MYQAEISRNTPALILYLLDCSYSMSEDYGSSGMTKGEYLAKVCNESIDQIILSCEKGDEIRAYFEIGIIGYSQGDEILVPIKSVIDLAYNPLKMEEDMLDGIPIERPIWFTDPTRRTNTDMLAGFKKAKQVLEDWTSSHKDSFPPVLIHVSDGEWTGGNPLKTAVDIMENVRTRDGRCIIMNIHISSSKEDIIIFPSAEPSTNRYQEALFQMSSKLPDSFFQRASEMYPGIQQDARGYMFNAQPDDLTKFFDIGTRLRG